jgi:predicted metal-dependent hydrolase
MVSAKKDRIESMIGSSVNGLSPYYTGFFERFNRHEFFEAHDVLEQLWLKDRHGVNGAFYKGLIQLAGAFVHVRKKRRQPALALLGLAHANLVGYPAIHEKLSVHECLDLISTWEIRIQESEQGVPELPDDEPRLCLISEEHGA